MTAWLAEATLEDWARVCAAPVIGRTGYHLTYPGGPAHSTRGIPWATSKGVSLRLLHGAYTASRVAEARYTDSGVVRHAQPVVGRQRGRLLSMREATG